MHFMRNKALTKRVRGTTTVRCMVGSFAFAFVALDCRSDVADGMPVT